MKRLLLLLLFCFPLQAQDDSGVDIAFMDLTGVASLDVFLIDVDDPDAEPVKFSNNFDISLCYENSDGSDEAFAECELSEYPPYLGVWRLLFENEYFIFENLETGERLALYRCVTDCEYEVSLDGRWLILEDYRLLDLSLFEETEARFIGMGRLDKLFWLNEHQLLYWQNEYRHYVVYDTETSLHYPFEMVLDRESLSVSTDGVEGLETPPEPNEVVEFPAELQGLAMVWDWRSDGALIYGNDNTISFWDGEHSEDLLSIPGEYDEATQSGGWYVQDIGWSQDETAFIAGFWEYGAYHQPNHYWYYHLETGEYYEVFSGAWVQWLR